MPDISAITLPTGNTYNFKDAEARASIPTKTSDLENDNSFVNAEFVGTALLLGTASEFAEGVSF